MGLTTRRFILSDPVAFTNCRSWQNATRCPLVWLPVFGHFRFKLSVLGMKWKKMLEFRFVSNGPILAFFNRERRIVVLRSILPYNVGHLQPACKATHHVRHSLPYSLVQLRSRLETLPDERGSDAFGASYQKGERKLHHRGAWWKMRALRSLLFSRGKKGDIRDTLIGAYCVLSG